MVQDLPVQLDIDALRSRVTGRVLAPGDDGYDEARRVAQPGVDRQPAVIVRVAGPEDVAQVIALARVTGLELAVRAGGHSGAGHSAIEGGILLDVRDLDSLEIDVEGRTAWAGAGLTAGAYTQAVAAHGLATGFGDTASVGIAGITLGGGMGYLVRKHGLTIDQLLAAEVVTADGTVHLVDEASEPDLFWSIRGGAGNTGVVTRFRYRLHPVDQLTGGMLFLPARAEVLAGLVAELDRAPEELSAIINVMPCPPMPFVPPEHHGELVAMVMLCHVGDPETAAAAIAPIRALAEPVADLVRPIAYPELYPPEPPAAGEMPPTAVHVQFLEGFGEAEAAIAVDRLRASDAPMRVVQLRVLGGAAARVPADATAYAHRDQRLVAAIVSAATGPDDLAGRKAWVEALAASLRPAAGAYVNFLEDEGPERVRAAYPGATWDRLASIKGRYDPDNLFRHVHNVPPAPGA